MIGKAYDGLYLVEKTLQSQEIWHLNSNYHTKDHSILWHHRMGYALLDVIKHLDSLNKDVVHSSMPNCDICSQAKQTRLPFPCSTSITHCIFELLHVDT